MLQGRGYAKGVGALQEFPIRKRTPFGIWINALGPDVRETVEAPDAGTVQGSIGRLIKRTQESG